MTNPNHYRAALAHLSPMNEQSLTFAQSLRKARTEKGWTAKRTVQEIKVASCGHYNPSVGMIYEWERSQCRPLLDAALCISKVMGFSLDSLRL